MRCAAAPGGSRSPRPGPRRGRPGEAVARGLHVPAPPAPRPAPRAPARRPPRRPGRERARPEGRAGPGRGAGGDSETLRGPPRARCGAGDARLRAYFLVPEEARKRREDGQRPPVSPTLARGPPSRWGRPGTPGAHGLGGAHLPGARVCKQTARLISLAGARAEGGGGASARAQGRPRPGRRRARLRPHLPTSCPPPTSCPGIRLGPGRSSSWSWERAPSPSCWRGAGDIPGSARRPSPAPASFPVRGRNEIKGP